MRARARMRSSLTVLAALLGLLGPSRQALADAAGAGTRAASFLQAGGAPRWSAMGDAGLASGSDLASAMWNAAALASLPEVRWAIATAELPGGVQQSWASVGGRHASGTRWGMSALHRSEGAIEGRDEANRPTQSFEAQSVALGLTLARPVGSWLSLGGSARYVGEHIGAAHGDGVAFGAGAQVRLGVVRLALAGQDFGGGMRWEGQQWAMPATLGAGLALVEEGRGVTLAADLLSPAAGLRSVRTGAEWTIGGRASLRAGWRHDLGAPAEDAPRGPSLGLGIAAGPMWLDYSFEDHARSSGVHRVGLTLTPGRLGSSPPRPVSPGDPGFIGPALPPGAGGD